MNEMTMAIMAKDAPKIKELIPKITTEDYNSIKNIARLVRVEHDVFHELLIMILDNQKEHLQSVIGLHTATTAQHILTDAVHRCKQDVFILELSKHCDIFAPGLLRANNKLLTNLQHVVLQDLEWVFRGLVERHHDQLSLIVEQIEGIEVLVDSTQKQKFINIANSCVEKIRLSKSVEQSSSQNTFKI